MYEKVIGFINKFSRVLKNNIALSAVHIEF